VELDKQIEELKKEQRELVSQILGSNPQWCFIQGKIEALTSVKEDKKAEVKK